MSLVQKPELQSGQHCHLYTFFLGHLLLINTVPKCLFSSTKQILLCCKVILVLFHEFGIYSVIICILTNVICTCMPFMLTKVLPNFTQNALLFDRFPIPDLRNGSEVSKLPWWQKNLRDELLVLDLQEARFQTSFLSNQPLQQLELSSRNILGEHAKTVKYSRSCQSCKLPFNTLYGFFFQIVIWHFNFYFKCFLDILCYLIRTLKNLNVKNTLQDLLLLLRISHCTNNCCLVQLYFFIHEFLF